MTIDTILSVLADQRWKDLRRKHNQRFMSGPRGTPHDYTELERLERVEIAMLRKYLGLPPEA